MGMDAWQLSELPRANPAALRTADKNSPPAYTFPAIFCLVINFTAELISQILLPYNNPAVLNIYTNPWISTNYFTLLSASIHS
jgi:hypothetical protein